MDIHYNKSDKLTETMRRRLAGCYGSDVRALIDAAQPEELKEIPTTCNLWAELRWAAHDEGIDHLEDLMLRHTRLGLTIPEGGKALLPVIRSNCQAELGWEMSIGKKRNRHICHYGSNAIICQRKLFLTGGLC
jgi:glycerol-3-phosphate dehydrogenase